VIQAGEIYQAEPIFYSLGNFVFDWHVMRGRHLDGLAAAQLDHGEQDLRDRIASGLTQ
jgi:hypothetical protein